LCGARQALWVNPLKSAASKALGAATCVAQKGYFESLG
jgi:hypothetical protein